MQIILSDAISNDGKIIVNNSVLAIFKSKKIDKAAFEPERSIFISNNTEDKADFYFDITTFINQNRSHKMIILKNLANAIFGEYVDPRDIIGNYEILSPAVPTATVSVPLEPVIPVIQETEKPEQEELETIKEEIIIPKAVTHSTPSVVSTGFFRGLIG
jgi:hypothetical protein